MSCSKFIQAKEEEQRRQKATLWSPCASCYPKPRCLRGGIALGWTLALGCVHWHTTLEVCLSAVILHRGQPQLNPATTVPFGVVFEPILAEHLSPLVWEPPRSVMCGRLFLASDHNSHRPTSRCRSTNSRIPYSRRISELSCSYLSSHQYVVNRMVKLYV